jgi:hypothetical protein
MLAYVSRGRRRDVPLTGQTRSMGQTTRKEFQMSVNISAKLSHISKAASEINKLADQATEQIRTLEAHLQQMNLGISVSDVWIAAGREANNSGHQAAAVYYVGYGRDDDGKFGIIVEAMAQTTDDDGKPQTEVDDWGQTQPMRETLWVRRLERCSRDLRVAAVKHLPAVVEQISKKAEETIASLRGGVEETQAVVDELKAALQGSAKK